MPRRPAQKPWLAEGVSCSTWYRRGGRITQLAFIGVELANMKPGAPQGNRNNRPESNRTRVRVDSDAHSQDQVVSKLGCTAFDRAETLAAALARDLDQCALANAVMTRELAVA
jgi:hypothetical protein